MQGIDLQSGLRGGHYLLELECLRGIAIGLVFLFHAYGISFGNHAEPTGFLLSFVVHGATGVTLFFVLSGFLLSLPWLNHLKGTRSSAPSIKNYAIARALRVLPLYYAAVLFAIVLSGQVLTGLQAATFMFVGFDIFPYSVVWWTLSTEIQFYLALPLFFWALSHNRVSRVGLIVLLAVWLWFYLDTFVLSGQTNGRLSYLQSKSLFGRLPAFAIGIFCAWLYLQLRESKLLQATASRPIASALTALLVYGLGLVLQQVALMGDGKADRLWHIHHSYEALLWGGLILVFVLGRPLGRALVVNRPLAMAGKLSYSLYLVHVPVLFYLIYPYQQTLGKAAYLESHWLFVLPAAGLFLSLVVAAATYRLIEMPGLRLKGNIPRYQSDR